jgi:uncharacterized membrane protein YkvA (DUF1232 family)
VTRTRLTDPEHLRRTATTMGAAAATAPRGHSWSARLRAMPSMVGAVLRGRWSGARRGPVLLALLGLLYVVMPVDFMPEALLGPFGLGDDIGVAAISLAVLVRGADAYLDDAATGTARPGPRVVPGEVVTTGTD